MARQVNRLNARLVQNLQKPDRHADGANRYLIVVKNGAKRWAFIYRCQRSGRLREMGLGGLRFFIPDDPRLKIGEPIYFGWIGDRPDERMPTGFAYDGSK